MIKLFSRSKRTISGYEPILPTRKHWPVVQLSRQQDKFIEEVIQSSMERLLEEAPKLEDLVDELETTLYRERLRIRQNPWAVDPEDEESFWKKIKSKLVDISAQHTNGNSFHKKQLEQAKEILRDIVSRYAHEISSTFKPSSYRLARNIVTFGFARLLNASRVKGFRSFYSNQYSLRDKINIVGEVELLRELAQKGTIIMVPTHFSNLDSILIGWVIHELGLPPFIYGAGLNLFNINIFAYFMNSLGAYKVDRRKKNKIYIETLKAYSRQAIRWGCHSLFFPGGTRSRSGKVEDKLKLGLLGTAMEAQRLNYEQSEKNGEEAEKIFVVPVVLNYHFVLEAPSLIRDHLSIEGQERYYIESDEYSNSSKIIKFLFQFFTEGSDISVSFGKPMDLMGNLVDEEGRSLDKHGRMISMREYFCSGGKITRDIQRESEYTRMLGEAILKSYHINNRVFSSHLVAFTAFEMIRQKYPYLDLYNFLRTPEEEQIIAYEDFQKTFSKLREEVFRLHKAGKVDIAPHLKQDVDLAITHGIDNVGLYHSRRPLLKNKEGNIITHDLNTLFYYHNRMEGYGLEQFFTQSHSKKQFIEE
ncbi:1-acyl-sn-glycerol-3-phosphate acyltransferase [Catalinimonas niigatensis]|uniref:1-acyl-sn-glycerol-3-phosphate acyltransferase n=1 Tax=Catalinimonas niigatensis TaxID=1397264 RepID=UPI002665C58B|nr:1-acyl-sn-glycerol-3-phosphate acyltransferase [Catalinimonas niigatensis]WPP48548.1 1-acyl-sn-glycerol-3-phosphate acyltransferase [Catalinimonas niigatensis]